MPGIYINVSTFNQILTKKVAWRHNEKFRYNVPLEFVFITRTGKENKDQNQITKS